MAIKNKVALAFITDMRLSVKTFSVKVLLQLSSHLFMICNSFQHDKDNVACGWEVGGPFFHVSWCCIEPWADPTALVESACGIVGLTMILPALWLSMILVSPIWPCFIITVRNEMVTFEW